MRQINASEFLEVPYPFHVAKIEYKLDKNEAPSSPVESKDIESYIHETIVPFLEEQISNDWYYIEDKKIYFGTKDSVVLLKFNLDIKALPDLFE